MTITRSVPSRVTDQIPLTNPRDLLGKTVEPALRFDDWDTTPHAIYPMTPVESVALGDMLLGGTHQVEGIGRSDQRGKPAFRFDLEYVVAPADETSGRLVLPLGHVVEVKRYFPDAGHAYAVVKVHTGVNEQDYPAGLVPDYRSNTELCCDRDQNTLNPHGYEPSATICDDCADDWRTDHTVVRWGPAAG